MWTAITAIVLICLPPIIFFTARKILRRQRAKTQPKNKFPRGRSRLAATSETPKRKHRHQKEIRVMTCRSCTEKIMPGKQHHCSAGHSFMAPPSPTEDSSDFVLSYIVASATDNALLGYAVGGSPFGAILGDSTHVVSPASIQESSQTHCPVSHSTYDSGSSPCSSDSGSSSSPSSSD